MRVHFIQIAFLKEKNESLTFHILFKVVKAKKVTWNLKCEALWKFKKEQNHLGII